MTRAMTALFLAAMWAAGCAGGGRPVPTARQGGSVEWPAYGGDPGGTRFSAAAEIHRGNVKSLAPAWTYRTGELGEGSASQGKLTFEATPLYFDGLLLISTAFGKVIALDPATGAERWTFDPRTDRSKRYSELVSRGVAAWRDSRGTGEAPCVSRVFLATIDARLFAIDARTGAPCDGFGEKGIVDLASGVGARGTSEYVDYQVTSPPAVIGDLVVVGSSIGDNWHVDTGDGVVRAFDARTGVQRWKWDPIPRVKGQVGAANAWAPISVDPRRDMVFVPTGSPSPDFFGGLRHGDNRHANSVVALRGSTGELLWSFQTVHHDLWDFDLAAQPALVTVRRNNREIPAVAQATKMGSLFLLHRETGEPLFDIEERPVPASTVPGESAWATQPFPTKPRALMPQDGLRPEAAWGPTDADRDACRKLLERFPSRPMFSPPTLEGSVMYPGNSSGTNWGSVAFHPGRQLLLLNTSRLATFVQLIPREELARRREEAKAAKRDVEFANQRGAPYGMMRHTLLSPGGMPCNPPPWGTLAAVDLSSGEVKWEVPLGRLQSIAGVPNGGGPIATAGDLVFIAASMDEHLRAFDVETGQELWSAKLPRSAIATPMTYRLPNGAQYVVVASGGHGKMGLPVGDFVVAFRIP